MNEWTPKWCANDTELACPKCGEVGVIVREQSTYYDGEDVEAACPSCHVELTVQASVEIVFHDARES